MTSCNDSPAVWTNSAYGFSNPAFSGVMLGLDTGHSFFHREKDAAPTLQQVVYPSAQEKWYLSDFFSGKDKDEKKRSVVLYSKNSSFCYEHEWRLAFIPHSAGKPEVVPPGLIKSVYIGTRAGAELTSGAFTFCCQHCIPLFRMVPSLEGTLQPELYLFP